MNLKTAIVLGRVNNSRRALLLPQIIHDLQPYVFSLDHANQLSDERVSFKHMVFSEKTEMAGYMPELESKIAGFDLVIAYESYQLASFQALRIAHKRKIPFWLIVDDAAALRFAGYNNIRAIQLELFRSADRILCSSFAAKEALLTEGVEVQRIMIVPMRHDVSSQDERKSRGIRMKNYLKIAPNEKVITYLGELKLDAGVTDLLKTASMLRDYYPDAWQETRLVFCGTGSDEAEIKYAVHDSQLSRNTIVINQFEGTFWQDLLCASDVLITPHDRDVAPNESSLIDRVLALGMGCLPVVNGSKLEAEIFRGFGVSNHEGTHRCLAGEVAKIFKSRQLLDETIETSLKKWQLPNNELILREHAERLKVELETVGAEAAPVESRQTEIIGKDVPELELQMNDPSYSFDFRARCSARLGQKFLEQRRFDESITVFSIGLGMKDNSIECLVGLGSVSYQMHSFEESLKFYKKAIAIDGECARATFGIGMVYAKLKLHEDALGWLEKSLHADSKSVPALIMILQCGLESENSEEALAVFERLREMFPQDESVRIALGRLMIKLGRVEDGRALIESAMAKMAG
jgi:tetratricopeptide (TPR) repeat protein